MNGDSTDEDGDGQPCVESNFHILRSVFGYEDFRPPQEEIILGLLDAKDALAIMPTGGGKSLCYQLAAIALEGVTVVVSPLIALMQDQVDALTALNMPATFLNSTLDYAAYVERQQLVRNNQVRLLYVAPETLARPETIHLLQNSQHDAARHRRGALHQRMGPRLPPRLPPTGRHPQPAAVRPLHRAHRHGHAPCPARHRQEPRHRSASASTSATSTGATSSSKCAADLATASTRSQTSSTRTRAKAASSTAPPAPASTSSAQRSWPTASAPCPTTPAWQDDVRLENQTRFIRDDVDVMVATIAFGMGIDKSNIRFVVHHNLPDCLDKYYQQIGRAGRDGLRADCLLLHSPIDLRTIDYHISQMSPAERPGAKYRLEQIQNVDGDPVLPPHWSDTTTSDRNSAKGDCGMCDRCVAVEPDVSGQRRPHRVRPPVPACVIETRQSFGKSHIIQVLRGSKSEKVLRWGHDKLTSYGAGRLPEQ